jgi:hypothetical protein
MNAIKLQFGKAKVSQTKKLQKGWVEINQPLEEK